MGVFGLISAWRPWRCSCCSAAVCLQALTSFLLRFRRALAWRKPYLHTLAAKFTLVKLDAGAKDSADLTADSQADAGANA